MNNFDRLKRVIRSMTLDQFADFLLECGDRGADWYTNVVCNDCGSRHGGCPTGGNGCIYPDDYKSDVKIWLESEGDNND